eukprot:COSAG02_NODE_577_length_20095_cov_6.816413_6_plen_96_part_00
MIILVQGTRSSTLLSCYRTVEAVSRRGTVHSGRTEGWMRKFLSLTAESHINRSVLRSAFHCTFHFLQQSSFRIFIARSLLSPVVVNLYRGRNECM